jgi:hypothetical protein
VAWALEGIVALVLDSRCTGRHFAVVDAGSKGPARRLVADCEDFSVENC